MVSRRQVLALGGGLSTVGLSGCAALGSDTDTLTVILLNFDSEPHTFDVELARPNADRYSEAIVLQEQYDLETPPDDAVAAEHREPDALENDTYHVSVHLADAPATRETYRYYPGCPDDDEADSLYIEVRTERESDERYVQFRQDRCSGSSGWP
ncbi:hypothetical protein [Natrinema versiforme]|uniref:Lipoprotein n=1 Tax=Natrinema versiforme JCM 10478 TaxID=1227496 RepID=L9YBG8_9EURY|nr:hypothetical protein [Natrinema versiforme]ELY71047.1 hypothetical protein C489_01786 [Natrinema versiforme JCM 10478]